MGLFDLFNKKQQVHELKENNSYLALDIGNESVKALVYKKASGKIEILGFSKAKQQNNSIESGFITNLQAVMETCDLAIGEACEFLKEKDSLPEEVILGIAGDVVLGEVINASIERPLPKDKITQPEIHNIINNIKNTTLQESKLELAEKFGIEVEDLEYINLNINNFKLDNRYLNSILGESGRNLIINSYLSFGSSMHLEGLRSIADFLELKLLEILPVPYSIYQSINSSKYNQNAIFIDIGGGTTDIAIYNNDTVYGTRMFSLAGQEFTHMISSDLSINYDEAEEKKILYSLHDEKKDLTSEERKIRKTCKEVSSNWMAALAVCLRQIEDISNYPAKIYLSGGGSKLQEIKEAIIEYPWLNKFNFDKFPSVEYLEPIMLKPFKDPLHFMKGIEDITALSLALQSSTK